MYSSVENKVVASRRQIPLVLSYGITIHKAQGLTMDRVEVDVRTYLRQGNLVWLLVGLEKRKDSD